MDDAATVTVPAANVTRADPVDAGVAPNTQHGFVLAVGIPAATAVAVRANSNHNHNNSNSKKQSGEDVTHVVHVAAPNATRFSLDSSSRCFQGVTECPCS